MRFQLAALFVAVLAVRLAVIAVFGQQVPYSDEWDAGAANLYAPFEAGTLTFDALLAPHNEHRIFTSRMIGLVAYAIAGWNPMLLMAVNAALWAGFAVWLAVTLAPLAGRRRLALTAFIGIAFAIPFGFENLLLGMNAHFYLVVIFGVLAIQAFAGGTAWSPRWLLGGLLATLAFFSMASGAAVPIVAAVLMALQQIAGARARRPLEFLGQAALIAMSIAMVLATPVGPGEYRATSIWQYLSALSDVAALPLATPVGAALVQAPLVYLLYRTICERRELQAAEWTALGMAGFVAAQMVLIAYSRATLSTSPRYFDIILLGPVVGAAVCLGFDHRPRWLGRAWVVAMSLVLVVLAALPIARGVVSVADDRLEAQQRLTRYLAGDVAALYGDANRLPYPSPERLIGLLADPAVRRVLPTEFQTP